MIEKALVKQRGKDAPATMYVEVEGSLPEKYTSLAAEAIEIEMEFLHPFKEDIMGVESGHPSVLSPVSLPFKSSKADRVVKWGGVAYQN